MDTTEAKTIEEYKAAAIQNGAEWCYSHCGEIALREEAWYRIEDWIGASEEYSEEIHGTTSEIWVNICATDEVSNFEIGTTDGDAWFNLIERTVL